MDNNEIIAYLLENERKRYEYAKELQKTLRWGIIGFLAAVTIIVSMYIYFAIPVEELKVDNGSKAVVQATVDNGGQIWQ